MKYDFKIYQIKEDKLNIMFMGYDFLKIIKQEKGIETEDFNMKDFGYELSYQGQIDSQDIESCKDDIYKMFNIDRPEDFTGRSLSVSDVIYIQGNYYYCDSFGWKTLENVIN